MPAFAGMTLKSDVVLIYILFKIKGYVMEGVEKP